MNWKRKVMWLGSALMLGLSLTGPALADVPIGTLDVEVKVNDVGEGMAASLVGGNGPISFGEVDAAATGQVSGEGYYSTQSKQFEMKYEHDTKLHRSGSEITLTLGDGTLSNAYLGFTGTVPAYITPSQVNLQIPGRYLTIDGMINPQQLKWTGGTGSTGAIWSNNGNGRVPRVAGSVGGDASSTTGKAIYKVGDIGGAFGQWTSGTSPCKVTDNDELVLWPTDQCGDNSFGEAGATASHLVAHIYEGSGFVEATHTIQLGLKVPAGVYPGTYTGTLTIAQIAAP